MLVSVSLLVVVAAVVPSWVHLVPIKRRGGQQGKTGAVVQWRTRLTPLPMTPFALTVCAARLKRKVKLTFLRTFCLSWGNVSYFDHVLSILPISRQCLHRHRVLCEVWWFDDRGWHWRKIFPLSFTIWSPPSRIAGQEAYSSPWVWWWSQPWQIQP